MKKMFFIFFIFTSYVFTQHFNVEIDETGESSLFIFEDSIATLSAGDEIGSLRVTMDPKFSFIRVICGFCGFKSKIYYKDILEIDGILNKHGKELKYE